MPTSTPFTPAEIERFADVCSWCANGVSVWKNTEGKYVHFTDGRQECAANRLRKQLEQQPIDAAREIFHSDTCPICKGKKKADKYFFCWFCERKLPGDIRSALRRMYPGWITQFLKAVAILKAEKKKQLENTEE